MVEQRSVPLNFLMLISVIPTLFLIGLCLKSLGPCFPVSYKGRPVGAGYEMETQWFLASLLSRVLLRVSTSIRLSPWNHRLLPSIT